MNKIKALIFFSDRDNQRVLRLILISAFILIVIRCIGPFRIGGDQAYQMESGHRLVKGLGLTTTYVVKPLKNINLAPRPENQTAYTPGFSILIACILSLGVSLALSLKIIYSVVTLVGWFGWAIIGSYLLKRPIKIRGRYFPLQLIIATLLPLFYTPPWTGTDIFLWAGVPFIVILLVGARMNSSRSMSFLFGAGLIFGLSFALRYASLFISIFVFVILFQLNFPRWGSMVRSYLFFFAGSCFFIFPISVYNYIFLHSPLPSFIDFLFGIENFREYMTVIGNSWVTVSYLLGFPPLATPSAVFISIIGANTTVNFVFGIMLLSVVIWLPIFFIRRSEYRIEEKKRYLVISLSLVILSLIFFLNLTKFICRYLEFNVPRYYFPAIPANIYIIYELVVMKNNADRMRVAKRSYAVKMIASIMAVLLVYSVINEGNVETVKRKWEYLGVARLVRPILGYIPTKGIRYASNRSYVSYSASVSKVRELKKEADPETIFFVHNYPYYVYDGYEGLRPFPAQKDLWKDAYVEKATRVYWVIDMNWRRKYAGVVADIISSIPGLRTVAEYPNEGDSLSSPGTVILVSDLPKGYEFLKSLRK